ncbi:MAG: hypothetical protein CBC12_13585, partial [Candidatus Puniceispirillum sp. TMED52]
MPAMADDFYDGLRAYDSGDYKTALRIFKPLADELGHAEAEYRLGWMYRYGWGGLSEDKQETVKWYRMAAEQENTDAYFFLGNKQDNADAYFFLGNMYDLGEGVEQDSQKADKWWRMAAE